MVHDLHANSTKVTEMCESLCLIAFKAGSAVSFLEAREAQIAAHYLSVLLFVTFSTFTYVIKVL